MADAMRLEIVIPIPMMGNDSNRAATNPNAVWSDERGGYRGASDIHTSIIPFPLLHICSDLLRCHLLQLEILRDG